MTHALQQGTADHRRNYRRREAAAYVREKHNVPCAAATLATLASRGGGPCFCLFGRIPIYSEEDLDAWVEARMGAPVRSTSEARSAPREPHRKMPIPSTAPSNASRSTRAEDLTASVQPADNVPAPGEPADKVGCIMTETGAATTSAPLTRIGDRRRAAASGGLVT